MRRKLLIGISFLLVISGLVWFYFFRSSGEGLVIQTKKAERGDLQMAITATGKLSPLVAVMVGTQVSGTVSKIYVDFNSQVKKGQVIAEIDKTYLSVAVEDARLNVEKAQIQADQAKLDSERTFKLYEKEAVSRTEYELAVTNYKTAISSLKSMRSQLNRALINLKYATIIAPIDGVVTARSVDIGQTVAASFNTPTLFTIANDLAKMQVEASVDEADIGQVKVGQEVSFTVDAFANENFKGQVKQIRLQPLVTQNVVTYNVIVDVANPDLKLLPGMTASIKVITKEKKNVMKIPSAALRFVPEEDVKEEFFAMLPDSIKGKFKKDAPGAFGERKKGKDKKGSSNKAKVWIKKGSTIVPVRVTTGLSDGSYTEVEGNITEEDELVISATRPSKYSGKPAQTQNPFAPANPQRGARRGM